MRLMMTIALVAGLALAAARAHAIWIETQIVPKYLNQYDQSFTISAKDVEGMKELRVSVSPKPGKEISPFTSGELMVIEENRHVATVPVAVAREGTKFTFRFRVSPAAAAASRFDIHEQGWTILHENGQPKPEMTLGGQAYWFWLRDFSRPAAGE